jgi:hypothetical protein
MISICDAQDNASRQGKDVETEEPMSGVKPLPRRPVVRGVDHWE